MSVVVGSGLAGELVMFPVFKPVFVVRDAGESDPLLDEFWVWVWALLSGVDLGSDAGFVEASVLVAEAVNGRRCVVERVTDFIGGDVFRVFVDGLGDVFFSYQLGSLVRVDLVVVGLPYDC